MRENLCTVVKLTPAHLHFVSDADNRASTVRQLIVGGENLTTETCRGKHLAFGGKVAIYNEYGPTEATVGCMIYQYDPMADIGSSVPIGRPIENLCIYVLDTHLDPLPMGEDGEIYIAGMGLAQGYVNHPLSTSQQHPQRPMGLYPIQNRRPGSVYPRGLHRIRGGQTIRSKINGYG